MQDENKPPAAPVGEPTPTGLTPEQLNLQLELLESLANRLRLVLSEMNARLASLRSAAAPNTNAQAALDSLLAKAKMEALHPHGGKVVCLCGSTKFKDAYEQANERETLEGHIVLSVGSFGHQRAVPFSDAEKAKLDELHKRKIDLADEIFVVNVGGYIGSSTRSEIEYATAHDKPVRYLEPPAALRSAATCELCHHSLADNMHGIDQNDVSMDGDKAVHSGSCTYCKYCNPILRSAAEGGE